MALLKGRAVVWSIGGVTFAGAIVSAPDSPSFVQSVRANRQSNKQEIIDDGGVIRTQVFSTHKLTVSITVIPADAASSLTGARASMNEHMFPSGGAITTSMVGQTIDVVDASGTVITDSYNCLSCTQNRSVDGVATLDLELEKSDEDDLITDPLTV